MRFTPIKTGLTPRNGKRPFCCSRESFHPLTLPPGTRPRNVFEIVLPSLRRVLGKAHSFRGCRAKPIASHLSTDLFLTPFVVDVRLRKAPTAQVEFFAASQTPFPGLGVTPVFSPASSIASASATASLRPPAKPDWPQSCLADLREITSQVTSFQLHVYIPRHMDDSSPVLTPHHI